MDKDFIIKQLYIIVESHKLWDEMANHIFAFGGELWESKYSEAYLFHEDLIYDLIVLYRGFPSLGEGELDCFKEAIFDLSRGNKTKLYDIDTNELVATLTSIEDLYNWMIQPQKTFIPKKINLI